MPRRSIHSAGRPLPRGGGAGKAPHRRGFALVLLLVVIAGCALPTGDARLSPAVAPLAEASGDVYPADTPTMKRMISRTVNELHWAVASLDDEVTAAGFVVWTPADQRVVIRSRQLDENRSTVQIRVGRFGDAKTEARFHEALAREIELWRAERRGS